MVGTENPSCNSVRIQRALRLNNIEQGRLVHQTGLLDTECTRHVRLLNQDMRIINLTMDYIGSSSGYSPEGLNPEQEEAGIAEDDPRETACFMYGERINSRRFGKNRRIRSAVSVRSRRSNYNSEDEDEDEEEANSESQTRPQSSPPKRKGLFITRVSTPATTTEDNPEKARPKTALGVMTRGGSKSPNPETTTKSGRPQSSGKKLGFSLQRNHTSVTPTEVRSEESRDTEKGPRPPRCGLPHARKSSISQAVSRARVAATNARSQKKHSILNMWLGPITPTTPKQKQTLEFRKISAHAHSTSVNKRLESFNKKYPLPRSIIIEDQD